MRDIAIFGAGGFGREIASLIQIINESEEKPRWNLMGFFDDGVERGTPISHFGKVLGGMKELNEWETDLDLTIAIGSPKSLRFVRERISNSLVHFPNVIHPDFYVMDSATFKIGEGNIIQGGCACSCDISIGNCNIFNGFISIGHDDEIGSFNVIMPAVRIAGAVHIGQENLIGVGSIILQQISIGKNVRLGAGAILMTKPKDGSTYIGNPAKIFKYE